MFNIYNNESAKGLPYIVFVTRNGKTERAVHLGKRGEFRTLDEARQAVHNATHYGTQNVCLQFGSNCGCTSPEMCPIENAGSVTANNQATD